MAAGYGREFLVGIVFFLLMGVLGTITLVLGRDVFQSTEAVEFRFEEVAGLTEGSEVWINGLPSGIVKEIAIVPDGTVTARARMRNRIADLDLSRGAVVEVKEKSSLGGAVVAVTTLRTPAPDAPKSLEALQSRLWKAKAGGFGSIGETAVDALVKSSEESPAFLGKALLGEEGVKDLQDGLDELRETVKSVRRWVDDADREDSALAVLLKDKETGRRLRDTVENLADLTAKARSTDSLVGKLVSDPEAGKKFDRILEGLDAFAGDLREGKGTLHKLVNDPSLYDEARAAVADLRKFTEGMNDEKGTVHRLLHDPKMADDLADTLSSARTTLDEVQALVADARSGKGTFGKLLTDDSLYQEVRTAVRSINRSFEESRENAPILTFAGFLFRAF
jgi:phospholipid/cholesterol/gamma-HCH transport system substrate-binding protein